MKIEELPINFKFCISNIFKHVLYAGETKLKCFFLELE